MITLRQLRLSRGSKCLLDNANVSLYEKQKIGLVGHNGCGKSSLFSLLLGEMSPDQGECQISGQLRISHLAQHVPDSEMSALDFVLSGDADYHKIQSKLRQAEKVGDDKTILTCHNQLAETDGYSKPAQAAIILAGLGFSEEAHQHSVQKFSGGWRMRLNLARCLMKPADLLLLDEPTNHLDMEAIFWLERWLKQTPCTVILISHDREFLDAFVSHILHIHGQSIKLYTGNYSQFETLRAQALALQQAQYEKQQKKIKHLMSFVERFRAKASKAKQAQSRLKAVEKMDVVAQAQYDSPFSFEFFPCPRAGKPLISCEDVSVGYDSENDILKNINLSIQPGERIALLGPNGQGKSTFIKALMGALETRKGTLTRSAHIQIGYYAQHQLEDLKDYLSPVQTIQAMDSRAREQDIRNFLGGFNFHGDMALSPIHYFSGGEKARLALAKLVWTKPNLLLLDEPTNHLDLGMRAAIELALQSFEGALILISHDRHLLKTTVDEYYLVFAKQVKLFDGDLDDYYRWLQKKVINQAPSAKEPAPTQDHRERKRLQNRQKKLEELLPKYQQQLKAVEAKLADPALYHAEKTIDVQSLYNEQTSIKKKLVDVEKEWEAITEKLD